MRESVNRNTLELERCILFPRSEEAAFAIENNEIDSRYEIDVIDLDYSPLSKLRLFGFFSYPKESGLNVMNNSFVKVPSSQVPLVIEVALKARKETNDAELLKLIDRFVGKSRQSTKQGLPIWLNT